MSYIATGHSVVKNHFGRSASHRAYRPAAPDAPVPLTPPVPAPAPAPTPPAPTPSPAPKLKVAPHYLPAHKDPWPANWRNLDAVELEDVICTTQAFGVNHRLEERHHRQLDKMRERLAVLRKADRALGRAVVQPAEGARAP
jgi:hypothetical protein